MMKSSLFFLLVFSTLFCAAQTRISGKVVDETSKQGIAGVSVYLNNTTCGTETDAEGSFAMSCPINSKAELVFSHVNYNKNIILIDAGEASNMNIQLSPRSNKLNEVVIKNKKYKPADIERWFNLFSLNLIGRYSHGSSFCTIQNQKMLNYYFDEDANVLHVSAFEPLEIENLEIGYRIKLDLESFEYAFATNEVSFKYSCLYEPLAKNSRFNAEQVKRNRTYAYYGSQMHFMRAVFYERLAKEDFEIYQYKAIRNPERKRISKLIQVAIAKAYAKDRNPDISLNRLFSRDSANYYIGVMKQKDVLSFTTTPLDLKKLISRDKMSRTVNFDFQDTILVNYVKYSNHPPPVTDPKHDKPREILPLSTNMYFFETGGINIDRNGYFPEFRLFTYGNMAERRIATALPFDYEPEL